MRLSRYQEIADTLARHGLGFLADAVGLKRWAPPAVRRSAGAARWQSHTVPERVRLALEDLGPTFVKLGQLLSARPDLLPQSFIVELSKLQDAGEVVPEEAILDILRHELGDEPEEVFARFDRTPLASASIGQAHAATLRDGTPVVVKVRRPDALRQVHEDLEILENLAETASRVWEPARTYNLRGIVQEFAQTLRAELDYLREGRNAERFAANFAQQANVHIPRVFWETTTTRVLTLERMTGIKISDITALDAAGIDRKALAEAGAGIILQMIFEDSFFHADLHPGNLFVHADGSVALIDFGMVGEMSEELHNDLIQFLIAFTRRNPEALTAALLDLSVTKGHADLHELRDAMASFVSTYAGLPLSEIKFTHLLQELLAIVRQQRLQLPREIALVFKVLITVEGIGTQLDPDFDLIGVLTPFVRRLIKQRLSAAAIARRVAEASADTGALLLELPSRLRRILETVDRGGIEVHLRAAELEPLVTRTERIGNRLVAGLITAALINGVGEIVVSEKRWRSWEGGLMGAGVTVVTGLASYLVWTTRRRRG
ncbi:phosphotransferase [Salinibacterium sp. dk2585]|nr:phosphotransferase [Salinibacterium sp. dk2585]TXK54862.1 phosphotransferase [Salinibacterium sp. dk5596]